MRVERDERGAEEEAEEEKKSYSIKVLNEALFFHLRTDRMSTEIEKQAICQTFSKLH